MARTTLTAAHVDALLLAAQERIVALREAEQTASLSPAQLDAGRARTQLLYDAIAALDDHQRRRRDAAAKRRRRAYLAGLSSEERALREEVEDTPCLDAPWWQHR